MSSKLIALADAVTAALNAGAFGQLFTAQRLYRPVFDLADLVDQLHVSVVPRSIEREVQDRSSNAVTLAIDIGVQCKPANLSDAALDELMLLVEQLATYLDRRELPDLPDAVWQGCRNVPAYDPEHLSELGQFTSVLTVTYELTE